MKGTALVTGASSGLGRDYARLFAADGHDVVLVARRRERLEELARDIGAASGARAHVVALDLAERDAARRLVGELAERGIAVDFLVNNAGLGTNGPFADADLASQLAMIQVNVATLVELTHLLLPGMLERGRGRILNIGSTAGFQPGPNMAVYFASKAFVNSFTEALAYELAGTGVTATVSCPGATATEFGEVAGNGSTLLFKMGAADSMGVAREGYAAMMAGQSMVVHGLMNKLGVQALRVSPRAVVTGLAARLNRS
jgi:short-subunit dehydrogenase